MTAWIGIVATLTGLVADGDGPGDVAGLVKGLSAPRRADRDRAAARLEAIGEPARAALVAAAGSTDLELRGRAAAVLDAIEGAGLVRPTLARLDFRDRPLGEIVAGLAERTGVPIALAPSVQAARSLARLTLEADTPVPFWEAVDRLGRLAGLRAETGAARGPVAVDGRIGAVARGPGWPVTGRELLLAPADGPGPPESRSGRFLVVLSEIRHTRDLSLPGPGGRPPGRVVDSFEARLRVVAEPGVSAAAPGPVERLVVEDDRGQSLVPTAPEPAVDPAEAAINPGITMTMRLAPTGQPMTVALKLAYPDRPAATIRRIAGALPITVVGSKPGPLAASLVDRFGQAARDGESSLVVHAVGPMPGGPPGARRVELSLSRPIGPVQVVGRGRLGGQAPPSAQAWLDFVDARGRTVERVSATALGLGDGARRTIRLVGDPVEVRYLAPTWTTALVPFEFRDVPMP